MDKEMSGLKEAFNAQFEEELIRVKEQIEEERRRRKLAAIAKEGIKMQEDTAKHSLLDARASRINQHTEG